MKLAGFPHSETIGSNGYWLLPDEYRRQLRPSSATCAKAFTVCVLLDKKPYHTPKAYGLSKATRKFVSNFRSHFVFTIKLLRCPQVPNGTWSSLLRSKSSTFG